MTFQHFYGIDVSKAKLDAADSQSKAFAQSTNDPEGIQQLIDQLPEVGTCLIVVEATGGYERALVLSLVNANHVVCVVNPRQVRDFAKTLGILAKTDKIDAHVIAKFGELVRPRAVAKKHEKQDELADQLVTRRRQLINSRKADKNRQGQAASTFVCKSIQRSLDHINKEIKRHDEQIAKLLQSNDDWRNRACGGQDGVFHLDLLFVQLTQPTIPADRSKPEYPRFDIPVRSISFPPATPPPQRV